MMVMLSLLRSLYPIWMTGIDNGYPLYRYENLGSCFVCLPVVSSQVIEIRVKSLILTLAN